MIDPTKCSMCDDRLAAHHKYVAAYAVTGGGIVLRPGCEHLPIPNLQLATAVFASTECLLEFVHSWSESLHPIRTH